MFENKSGKIKKGLFACLLAAAFPLLHAAELTVGGVELATGDRTVIREVRLLDEELCSLFGVLTRRTPSRCRIMTSDRVAPGMIRVRTQGDLWILELNPEKGAWVRNKILRKKLMAYLLASKLGKVLPQSAGFVPEWVAAGIEARLAARKQAEQFLRNNRYFPVVRSCCESGRMPDFRVLMQLDPQTLSPAGRVWYDEFSRVLLETASACSARSDNALLDYLRGRLKRTGTEEQIYNATLRRIFLDAAQKELPEGRFRENREGLSEPLRVQRFLEYSADRIACNDYFPRPAAWTQEQFRQMRDLRYRALDEEGNPSGEVLTLPLEELPGFLLRRPDAFALKRQKMRELNTVLPGADPDFAFALRQLVERIWELPLQHGENAVPAEKRFRQALGDAEKSLALIEARESWFDREFLQYLTPFELHRLELETLAAEKTILPEAAEKYLEEIERLYLDE